MTRKQLIRILGLESTTNNYNSTDAEIRKAFRGWSKVNHPDKGGDSQLFAEVSDAITEFISRKGAIIKGCFVKYEGKFREVVGTRGPRYVEIKFEKRVVVITREEALTPVWPMSRSRVDLNKGYALVPAGAFYGVTKKLTIAQYD